MLAPSKERLSPLIEEAITIIGLLVDLETTGSETIVFPFRTCSK